LDATLTVTLVLMTTLRGVGDWQERRRKLTAKLIGV
jgi:hypothetical protein